MVYVLTTIAVVLVFGAIEVVRLVQDAGEPLQAARWKVVEYAVLAMIVALPLAVLARQAFNADGPQTVIVFITSVAMINHVSVQLYRLRKSFADNKSLKNPSLSLAWDVFLVTLAFGLAYFVLGVISGKASLAFGDAMYLSAITITTTGYGDVSPPVPARPLAMLEPFLGYALLGAWLATLLQTALSSGKKDQ